MSISRLGIVLCGAENDKEALLSAVRMAAREGARLRVVLAPGATRETCEKHLDFALWDVQQRSGLRPPEIVVESRLVDIDRAIEAPRPEAHPSIALGTQHSALRTA